MAQKHTLLVCVCPAMVLSSRFKIISPLCILDSLTMTTGSWNLITKLMRGRASQIDADAKWTKAIKVWSILRLVRQKTGNADKKVPAL